MRSEIARDLGVINVMGSLLSHLRAQYRAICSLFSDLLFDFGRGPHPFLLLLWRNARYWARQRPAWRINQMGVASGCVWRRAARNRAAPAYGRLGSSCNSVTIDRETSHISMVGESPCSVKPGPNACSSVQSCLTLSCSGALTCLLKRFDNLNAQIARFAPLARAYDQAPLETGRQAAGVGNRPANASRNQSKISPAV